MDAIFVLLSPLWLSWKNDFRRGGNQWGRRLLLLGLALASWCGTFFVIRRALLYFQSVYELGPALAYQPLLIILTTHLLGCCLPARRISDILLCIGMYAFVEIYFLSPFAQPERVGQPECFGNFMQFWAAMETPSPPFHPSSSSAESLGGSLFKR